MLEMIGTLYMSYKGERDVELTIYLECLIHLNQKPKFYLGLAHVYE